MVNKTMSEATMFCSSSTSFDFWKFPIAKLVLDLRFAKLAPLTNQI